MVLLLKKIHFPFDFPAKRKAKGEMKISLMIIMRRDEDKRGGRKRRRCRGGEGKWWIMRRD